MCWQIQRNSFRFFFEIDYSKKNGGQIFEIEGIRQDFDVTYVKLKNGDVFQYYFMMDDANSSQKVSIFKSNESNSYTLALYRFEQADDEVEIDQNLEEGISSILNWFDRRL